MLLTSIMFQAVQLILWILIISAFTFIGSWYARKYNKADLMIALYTSFVIISNIIAVKIVQFDFFSYQIFAPAAIIVFSVTFLMTDVVNEKFGRKETHKMILIAFICQIAVALFLFIAVTLKPAPFWTGQESFGLLFGQVPRIIFASWIAFLISENLDAIIFDWFKKKTKGKHLWMRNVFSSLPAMLLDSLIFVTIAFYGTMAFAALISVIFGQMIIKWLVGIINIPFMYLNRRIMS